MWAFLIIDVSDKMPDVFSSLVDVLIVSEVNFFLFEGADESFRLSVFPGASPPCDRNLNAMCLERGNISV